MTHDEIPHGHPATRRKSHRASLLVPLTAFTLVAILIGFFLTRSLAAPRPSSHATAVAPASPALQCGFSADYTSSPPYTLAGLKHASDIVVLGVVRGPADSSATTPLPSPNGPSRSSQWSTIAARPSPAPKQSLSVRMTAQEMLTIAATPTILLSPSASARFSS